MEIGMIIPILSVEKVKMFIDLPPYYNKLMEIVTLGRSLA